MELERSLNEQLPWALSPSFVHGMFLFAVDRIDEARRQFEEEYERAVALGRLVAIDLPRVARRGRAPGRELAEGTRPRAGNEGARSHGHTVAEAWGAGSSALVEAHLGNEDDAVRAGESASRLARADGFHLGLVRSEFALALLRLSLGDANAAARPSAAAARDRRGRQPMARLRDTHALHRGRSAGRSGRPRARSVRRSSGSRSMPVRSRCRQPTPRPRVAARSCSSNTATSRRACGDRGRALPRTRICGSRSSSRVPIWPRARSSVARSSKAEARTALGRAEAIFGELGARLWLERTQRESARTGVTRTLDQELTPTERRVAELAATGAQNKEIAGALFVSVKTVEANLSRVYAKLGIRSRVELASRLAKRAQHDFARTTQT